MDQYGAYARFLDCWSGTGGGSVAVLRVPTLAEWHGDVSHSSVVECGRCGGGTGVGRALGGVAGSEALGGVRASAVDGGCGGSSAGVFKTGAGEVVEGCGFVGVGSERGDVTGGGVDVVESEAFARGKHWKKNRDKKEKKKAMRASWRGPVGFGRGGYNSVVSGSAGTWRFGAKPLVDGSGGCVSDESVTGSVCTVDTRTGVEIAAAQTLAARRVAENERAEAEAKVAKKLAEHRLVALQDKDRTVAVQRLAAARYEQRINEAKAKSQASYKKCDESMKSLGSTGSAGEFALKQAVKEARDNAKTLKYVQEQADLFYQYATPEVRRMVAEMPEPEMEDEFDVFGDCPSDYNDEQREAYYDDLNRRNAEHGLVGSSPVPPRRELTPEEFLKIEEEIRALSANQV